MPNASCMLDLPARVQLRTSNFDEFAPPGTSKMEEVRS
jgi:hypothetical protein